MDCLVTKLKGSVSDSSLLKLNEIRFKLGASSTGWNVIERGIAIQFNEDTTLTLIGNGYFTNNNGTQNYGKTLVINAKTKTNVYVSVDEAEISIPNKYALTYFNGFYPEGESGEASNLDNMYTKKLVGGIGVLKYCYSLTNLTLGYGEEGDIAAIGNLTKLETLTFENDTNLYGDISSFSNLKALKSLIFRGALDNITGDISSLNILTNLTALNLIKTKLSGDIGSLGTLVNLQTLSISGSTNIKGDLTPLKDCVNLYKINLGSTSSGITGDISQMPKEVYFLEGSKGANSFTWKTTRSSDKKIIALANANMGNDVDPMLINQANCEVSSQANEEVWYKYIYVNGSRTSASDSAISQLQEKGFTIMINGASPSQVMTIAANDTDEWGIVYKGNKLFAEPLNLATAEIYPASDVTFKKFSTLEEANLFIESNGLVKVVSK